VLLRLAYLGVTNAFAVLRLLPMSNRDKDVEILALRHQITADSPGSMIKLVTCADDVSASAKAVADPNREAGGRLPK
jgi:hypothetical protein